MISIKEAEKLIFQNLPPRREEKILIEDSMGRFLCEDITALEASPRFTNSSMDGFALRYEDWKNGSRLFEIIGESRAGVPFVGEFGPGDCIRVSTGALLPETMDCVVPFERAAEKDGSITVQKAPEKWQYVRKEGSEFAAGTLLFSEGDPINPAKIGILAAQGILNIDVYARARVAIISTGSELVPNDSRPEGFQIRESNALMLAKSVENSGGEIVLRGKAPDDPGETEAAIESAHAEADIIISSGGISTGRHDHVRTACANLGFKDLFWRVDQKPGKPLYGATKDNKIFFGLPGNPVSTYMTYIHYVHPAICTLLGDPDPRPTLLCRWNSDDVVARTKGSRFIRVGLTRDKREILPERIEHRGSHMLTTVTMADGYVLLASGVEIKRGELVQVILFPV